MCFAFFETWPKLAEEAEGLVPQLRIEHHERLSCLEAAASHGCPLCILFLRQLEYNSQDIRKHRKGQRVDQSGDLEIRAKISYNYDYGWIEELNNTIQYDTCYSRHYDFSIRGDVTVQLHPFNLKNLHGEQSYGADP